MKSYRDHTLGAKERASLLLKEMSLDEKMAQINCVFPFVQDAYNFEKIQQETKYGMGEVSTLEMRRMETLDEVAAWQRKVQKIVMENSAHRIPAIFHMEGLCGAFIQDSTSFPSGIGRGYSIGKQVDRNLGKSEQEFMPDEFAVPEEKSEKPAKNKKSPER